jgi:hypothetical protein
MAFLRIVVAHQDPSKYDEAQKLIDQRRAEGVERNAAGLQHRFVAYDPSNGSQLIATVWDTRDQADAGINVPADLMEKAGRTGPHGRDGLRCRDQSRVQALMHWRNWMAVPVAGALFLAGSVAGVQAAGGTINACVNNGSGGVRVVAAGATCRNNETSLQWDVQGPPGAPGAPGTPGISGYEVIHQSVTVSTSNFTFPVACSSPSKHVLGGGADTSLLPGVALISSRPTDNNNGWSGTMQNPNLLPVTLAVWAVCATTT